jgi:periplasmic divalent cation tolerance protein
MNGDVQYQIVTTTVATAEDAERLARLAVEARLAACVQTAPIRSVYRWKGQIECAAEYAVNAKTKTALVPELMGLIRSNHPYELPEIVAVPIADGLPVYLDWIGAETR